MMQILITLYKVSNRLVTMANCIVKIVTINWIRICSLITKSKIYFKAIICSLIIIIIIKNYGIKIKFKNNNNYFYFIIITYT